MNPLIIVMVIIFVSGVVSAQIEKKEQHKKIVQSSPTAVLSEHDEEQSPSPQPTPSPTPSPVSTQVPTPTPLPTQPPSLTLSDFLYPGGQIQSVSGNSAVIVTSDPPDPVTAWYETKIKSFGFNVKTFVKTRANDKVLNKLGGAKEGLEVNVEISKNPGESTVEIKVTIQ